MMTDEHDSRRVSITRDELRQWATNSLVFFRLDLERISALLLAQVYACEVDRRYDTFNITDPIKALEGIGRIDQTSPPRQFLHPPLVGLYKKHFFSVRFLPRNLANALRSKEGKRRLQQAWDEGLEYTKSEYVTEGFIGYIAHHITVSAFETKCQNRELTGEWIVFHQHEGQNYYLTLASHRESNETIYQNVKLACEIEKYPFEL
mgnify:CR=1 FL=1